MEKYKIKELFSDEMTVYQGKYFNLIYDKHVNSFGISGANNIRDNIVTTFYEALKQVKSKSNHNLLLVGKVQSGKTSNLELFTALAFDNKYNVVVIYGGYDSTLLGQTTKRFKKTFSIPEDNEINYSDESPIAFTSDDSKQLLDIDDQIIDDLISAGKPIFIISMKRPAAMSKVNDLLNRIATDKIKAFIIDDEGDQASLNTKPNKKEDASATYAEIVRMKKLLNNPLYLSVTATPHANIFLDEISELRPETIRLIEPGKGYCGADSYHLFDNNAIVAISTDDHEDLDKGVLPTSMKSSIDHYIIASAIMRLRGLLKSDMIIHSYRAVSSHNAIYNYVNSYITQFKDLISYGDLEGLETKFEELRINYHQYFSENIIAEYPFDSLYQDIKEVVSRIYIVLKNSAGKLTQSNEALRRHKIYIGGDLLQRGVTFHDLVSTYFTRWAQDGGNMDTNLQRARWFGYRDSYIDLCKVFTTEDIAREFTNLSETETDLWEQFYLVQAGERNIEDILIQSDNTNQNPTRKSVVNVKKISFKSSWIKQRLGIFDESQLKLNNDIVDNLILNTELKETSAGRTDGGVSAKYIIFNKSEISILIKQIQSIFNYEPFEYKALTDLIESADEIPVILMKGFFDKGRERSFYSDNKIYALHQGADNKDKEKALNLGDSYVVVDQDKLNIQIHKIIPKKKTEDSNPILSQYTQYMFAIYVPKGKTYFMKG